MKKNTKVVWRGEKEEGMSYQKKVELIAALEMILVLNKLALDMVGNETLSNLDPARAERIKERNREILQKNVETCRCLPADVLEKLGDLEIFCYGYFSEEKRAVALEYFNANVVKK